MTKKKRINLGEGDSSLGDNPFNNINFSNLELSEHKPSIEPQKPEEPKKAQKSLGRVDIKREKAGRGGKTVTVIQGIENADQRESWLKKLQKQCACGGSIKETAIELQGDKRDQAAQILQDAGYRIVFAGG